MRYHHSVRPGYQQNMTSLRASDFAERLRGSANPKTVVSARVSTRPCSPGAKHARPWHHDGQLRSLRHVPPRCPARLRFLHSNQEVDAANDLILPATHGRGQPLTRHGRASAYRWLGRRLREVVQRSVIEPISREFSATSSPCSTAVSRCGVLPEARRNRRSECGPNRPAPRALRVTAVAPKGRAATAKVTAHALAQFWGLPRVFPSSRQ